MGIGIICMTGVVSLWSLTYAFTKVALRVVDPYTLAFLRLFQGLIFVTCMYKIRGGRWHDLLKKEKWFFIGGLGNAINYIFLALALEYTTASAGGLIVQFQFVALALLSAFILREKFAIKKTAGLLTIICGIMLVLSAQGALKDVANAKFALGNILMLLSALGWGVYALANKALSSHVKSLAIVIPILTIGTVATGITSALRFELRSLPSVTEILVIVILGVLCTGFVFFLLAEGLKRLNASVAGAMTGATPLLNMFLAQGILGEKTTPVMFASAALIIFGVLVIVFSEWRMNTAATRANPQSPS